MSNQLQITGGGKVRNLEGVITGTSGVLSSVPLGAANGVATLDSGGKVPVSQLPSSVVTYLGTWNAATNTPTLVNGTGDAGDMYICNVAGTVNFGAGPVVFVVGDWVLYGSGTWQKSSGQNGTVTSVGLSTNAGAITIGNSPISTSGTITANFNGTNLQYVNGAGNLTTFPILTGYVPYTGATQDVDLGAFKLNAQSLHIKGTAGNGHLGLKHQSASATASANEVSLFADSLGDLAWQNGNLYLSKFITSGNTAARSYTFPNANGTVALTSDLANYVDLTTAQTIGGTKTFSDATKNNGGIFLQNASSSSLAGYMNIGGLTNGVKFTSGGGVSNTFTLPSATGYTFTFPNATGTIALTSDISYPVTSVFGRTGAVVATSGDYTTTQVTEGTNLYFTDSRARLALSLTTTGTSGAATYNNTTGVFNIPNYAPDLSGYVTLAGTQTITGAKTFSTYSKFDGGVILKNNVSASLAGYIGLSAYSASGNKGINIDFDTYSASFYFSGTLPYQYTFPAASGTIALVGGSGVGTVTSVAALTIGTSGTDLSSSVANSTTTPVITLNVPTASATNRGALSSADWTTFNNKQSALTNPVTGTGTTNYLPKFTGASTIGNSSFYLTGNNLATSNATIIYSNATSGGTTADAGIYLNGTDKQFKVFTNDLGRLEINASGNLGLGVTPSAWATSNDVRAIQLKAGAFWNYSDFSTYFGLNYYWDGSVRKYIISDYASEYQQIYGSHRWFNAPSGTAGTTATFTQAMTLTAAGRLLINKTNEETYQLDVNGTGRFSNELRIDGAGIKLFVNGSDSLGGFFYQQSITGTTYANNMQMGASGDNQFWNYTTGGGWVKQLSIATTGAATFSSSVTATQGKFSGSRPQGIFTENGTSGLYLRDATGTGYKSWSIGTNDIVVGFAITPSTAVGGTTFTTPSFVINESGNVGIGTSSPAAKLEIPKAGTSFGVPSSAGISISAGGGVGEYNQILLGYSAGDFSPSAIGFVTTDGAGSTKGALVFGTRDVTTASAPTERMRITSGGALCLGVTSAYGTNLLNVNGGIYATSSIAAVVASDIDMFVFSNTGATYTKAAMVASIAATGGTGSYFFYGQQSTSTVALKIFSNGNIQNTNNSYGAISDARLKENIKDATPKLDDLMKVKVRNYNLKGESNKQLGVISQELEAIFPNMIEESTNMGENMKIKGVKYSVFVPMLIKAVQELKAEIEILKNK